MEFEENDGNVEKQIFANYFSPVFPAKFLLPFA
jgi:hypothetical protein